MWRVLNVHCVALKVKRTVNAQEVIVFVMIVGKTLLRKKSKISVFSLSVCKISVQVIFAIHLLWGSSRKTPFWGKLTRNSWGCLTSKRTRIFAIVRQLIACMRGKRLMVQWWTRWSVFVVLHSVFDVIKYPTIQSHANNIRSSMICFSKTMRIYSG